MQQAVRIGSIELRKVRGEVSPSDLLTKHLTINDRIVYLCGLIGCAFRTGRPKEAPRLRDGPQEVLTCSCHSIKTQVPDDMCVNHIVMCGQHEEYVLLPRQQSDLSPYERACAAEAPTAGEHDEGIPCSVHVALCEVHGNDMQPACKEGPYVADMSCGGAGPDICAVSNALRPLLSPGERPHSVVFLVLLSRD